MLLENVSRIVNEAKYTARSKKEWQNCLHVQRKCIYPELLSSEFCASYDHKAKIKYGRLGKPEFHNEYYIVLREINELVLLFDKN